MKNCFFLVFVVGHFLVGCNSSRDKYDLATDQVKRDSTAGKSKLMFEESELGKDGQVGEVTVKKGEKKPDGNIASEDTTMKTLSGPNGSEMQWTVPKNAKK